MKVGIITMHYGDNFGGLLQCLALQNTVASLGHEVQVVNYNPHVSREMPWWRGWGLRGAGSVLVSVRQRATELRHKSFALQNFGRFRSTHLRLTEKATTREGLAAVIEPFDILITGSDQVWNLNYNEDPTYFLEVGDAFQGRRVSYAACAGRNSKRRDAWVNDALRNIDALSVRNPFTAAWVKDRTGAEPKLVADPTMLYNFPELAEIAPICAGPYIFTYFLGDEIQGGNAAALRRIREIHGDIPVVCAISTSHKMKLVRWADQCLYELDPLTWLKFLAGASFVFTDSFHAVLLSMRYRRSFIGYCAEEIRSPRLLDLAARLGAEGRIVNGPGPAFDLAVSSDIDWERVEAIWEPHVHESMEFLTRAVAGNDD